MLSQLAHICAQTAVFMETTSHSKFVDAGTQSVATAVLDHPQALTVLDRIFGPRDTAYKPITDIVLVQSGEEVPPGYTKVCNTHYCMPIPFLRCNPPRQSAPRCARSPLLNTLHTRSSARSAALSVPT